MDLHTFFQDEFDRHQKAVDKTRTELSGVFSQWVEAAIETLKSGNKLVFIGNGGSASDAQHLATELTVRYKKNRRALAAIALTTDTSALTAIGNDFGFEDIFSRQVEALCREGDMLIGITTSGTSPNVLKAMEAGRALKTVNVGLSGRDGGRLKDMCDICLIVPHDETARIQEMHILLGHMLCGALEETFGAAE